MLLQDLRLAKDAQGNFIQLENGTYKRDLVNAYDVTIDGDKLIVNGMFLPIVYDPKWAICLRCTKILTTYSPDEFWKHFFEDEFWRDKMTKVCAHVEKHGRTIKEA